jgi:hypothetical protein
MSEEDWLKTLTKEEIADLIKELKDAPTFKQEYLQEPVDDEGDR